jgi:hypothetical protein
VIIRLSQTAVMGISTAVFSSFEFTNEGVADPVLKYARTFQVCIAFAGASLLISPLIRLRTQGNAPKAPNPERPPPKGSGGGEADNKLDL